MKFQINVNKQKYEDIWEKLKKEESSFISVEEAVYYSFLKLFEAEQKSFNDKCEDNRRKMIFNDSFFNKVSFTFDVADEDFYKLVELHKFWICSESFEDLIEFIFDYTWNIYCNGQSVIKPGVKYLLINKSYRDEFQAFFQPLDLSDNLPKNK
jgi:hypothetical protein